MCYELAGRFRLAGLEVLYESLSTVQAGYNLNCSVNLYHTDGLMFQWSDLLSPENVLLFVFVIYCDLWFVFVCLFVCGFVFVCLLRVLGRVLFSFLGLIFFFFFFGGGGLGGRFFFIC